MHKPHKLSAMKYFKQIDINTWHDFKNLVDKFPPEYIYRGQADSNWGIECSLERAEFKDLDFDIENRLIDDFKRVAHYYLNEKELPKTNLAWLALIQHYGTPTRLIDFTKSPYIASYFAFEDFKYDSDRIAIWCADKINLYQSAIYLLQDKFKLKQIAGKQYCYYDQVFDMVNSLRGLDCIMPFEISQHNERYYIQQSIFLVPLNLEKKTIDQLGYLNSIDEDTFVKITLPRKIYKTVLRDLYKMNITAASLFPGLDGYAKTLNMKYTIPHSLQELGDNYVYLKEKGIK